VNTIGKKEEPGKKRHTPHDSLEKQPIQHTTKQKPNTQTKHTQTNQRKPKEKM
jgi:hypothetical protein